MRQQLKPVSTLHHGLYYTITNCKTGLALTMPKKNKYIKDKPQFQQVNPNNINQLWMLEQISPNKYQIVHAVSTLVLQCIVGSYNCKLQFGKRKSSQLFYIEADNGIDMIMRQQSKIKEKRRQYNRVQSQMNKDVIYNQQSLKQRQTNVKQKLQSFSSRKYTYKAGQRFISKIRIKQNQKSRKYLFCNQMTKIITIPQSQQQKQKPQKNKKAIQSKTNILKFMEIDIYSQPQSTLWQITQIYPQQNQILSKCCYITSYRSGEVLDIPQSSDKQGIQIIQYPCNFRFNQKWIFQKVDEVNGYSYYHIKNAKNGLVLDIKGNLAKTDIPIIQWSKNNGKNQIWRLEQQGKRTYLIRSALDKDLLLGVKDNSLKQCAEIVTSKIQTQCFWVIYGNIPE